MECDILIIAIPCSLYNSIAWHPSALHPDRLRAMMTVTLGENAKFVYPVAALSSVHAVCEPPRLPEAKADQFSDLYVSVIAVMWGDAAASQRLMYLTGAPSYFTADTVQEAWSRMRPLRELLNDEPIANMSPAVCARDLDDQVYYGPVGHSWPCDPYARGSYACRGVGNHPLFAQRVMFAGERVNALFAPLNDGTLLFVGEHTTDDDTILGTMEAAVESGERIARIVANRLQAA